MIGAGFASYSRRNGVTDFFLYPALFSLVLQLIDLILVVTFLPETLPASKRVSVINQSINQPVAFYYKHHTINQSTIRIVLQTFT